LPRFSRQSRPLIALAVASLLVGCAARNVATTSGSPSNAQASTETASRETPAYRYGTGFSGLSDLARDVGGQSGDEKTASGVTQPAQPAVVTSPTAQPRETVAYRFGYGFGGDDSPPAQEAAAVATPAAQPAPAAAPVSITPQQKPAAR
jgi:hypothetical protein